ncbi:NADP-dependent oxidoreductase [Cohnella xylanilytica]|uniref:NADP-dependent oxidoreductase n=1 Tax=Cohnella xylanilytica TaxID=557555 RepID=UPI001BB302A8|nr:NADP-dependent oxidoreductase [Cohnella xylanilytica]
MKIERREVDRTAAHTVEHTADPIADPAADPMMAIRYHERGGPEVLRYERVPRPSPAAGELLVRVRASSVNPGDWQIRSGLAGDRFALPYVPGWDISGVVEQAGEGAAGFREGEEVYGMTASGGGHAEYAVIPAAQAACKPKSLSHAEAAAVPMSAFTAWRALLEQGALRPGETVLVNGAAGGVGHFAVQIAKRAGAKVVAVASGRNEAWLRELGADEFLDYTEVPVDRSPWRADLALDAVGGPDGDRLLAAVKPGGRLVPVAFGVYSPDKAAARSVAVGEVLMPPISTDALARLAAEFDAGRLRVVLDSVYPLRDAYLAHERSERRRLRGKIVIEMETLA